MALSAFPKAFELDGEEKGNFILLNGSIYSEDSKVLIIFNPLYCSGCFPHLCNERANWFRKWPSIPHRKYYSYDFMKPDQQKQFDQWYEEQIGKEFDQAEELKRYCS